MDILIYIICIVLGIAVGLLIGRNRKRENELEAQVKVLESRNASLTEQAARDKEEWQAHTRDMLDAQQAKFDETIAKVTAQMKSATEDMLKRRQEEFTTSSNASIGQIVNPLKETIDKMKEAMKENTLKQTSISSEIKTQAENMMRQSAAAKESTDELTRVFRHAGRVQGDWGEIVLKELLDSQGLTENVHYELQSSIRDAAGDVVHNESDHGMRPDVIMHLDQKREVIIDSKVSLTAFMDYVNAKDENDRQKYLKAHVESIQKHVKNLASKDYSSYVKPPKVKMDYVIMFVPNTGALWAALGAQPDLWRNAMEKNVYIADEQTLFAALRIINMTWTQIAQAQNHEKVYALANELMDRVGQFMDRYKAIGKALENAGKAYEAADKKLQPTGQSIIQTCAKLQKLGAKQSSRNPIPQLQDVDPEGGEPESLEAPVEES
ncbi:MAG: DNA recombination protein RmuC [Bacteroidaceae bacterium]|nr:DNA recombination protein RmuC [Bacteroidaceae bacterium]